MKITPSERLSYRLMTLKDQNLLFELDQDPEVMRFISEGKPTSEKDLNEIIMPRMASYLTPEKGWGIWAVSKKDNHEYIGWVLVRPMHFFTGVPEYENLELGWRFKRNIWGKGFATEAANHIMQTLSLEQGVKTFSAIAVKDNISSIKVMEKLGMHFEKSEFHNDPLINMRMEYYTICLD